MKKEFELPEFLKPKEYPIVINGSLNYCERNKSNSIIILQKEIRLEFTDLTKKTKKTKYRLEYFRDDYIKFFERTKEIIKAKKGIPMLLFLYKEEVNNGEY